MPDDPEAMRRQLVERRWSQQERAWQLANNLPSQRLVPEVDVAAPAATDGPRACPGPCNRAHRRGAKVEPHLAEHGLCLRCELHLDEALDHLPTRAAQLDALTGALGTSGMGVPVHRPGSAPGMPFDGATEALAGHIRHVLASWGEVVAELVGAPPGYVRSEHRNVLLALPPTTVMRWSPVHDEWQGVDLDGAAAGVEIIGVYTSALRRLGFDRPGDRPGDRLAAPCPECELAALVARHGGGVECQACPFTTDRDGYAQWQAALINHGKTA